MLVSLESMVPSALCIYIYIYIYIYMIKTEAFYTQNMIPNCNKLNRHNSCELTNLFSGHSYTINEGCDWAIYLAD